MHTLTLSEAIRLGSMLRPQGFDAMRAYDRTCALGAAAEAVGECCDEHSLSPTTAMIQRWPVMLRLARCPECGASWASGLGVLITHLNDSHRWTRECIADFVATIEAQHEQESLSEASQGAAPVQG